MATQGSVSSKRVCGVLGWLVCLGVLTYCTIKVIQAPVMVDAIIITSATLLGVDSITSIWKKNGNKRDNFADEGGEDSDASQL